MVSFWNKSNTAQHEIGCFLLVHRCYLGCIICSPESESSSSSESSRRKMGLSALIMGSSPSVIGTAGVGAGVGMRQSGPGEKWSSTAPSVGNLESATISRLITCYLRWKQKTNELTYRCRLHPVLVWWSWACDRQPRTYETGTQTLSRGRFPSCGGSTLLKCRPSAGALAAVLLPRSSWIGSRRWTRCTRLKTTHVTNNSNKN